MTPMTYIVKSGAATLPELSALVRSNKADVEKIKTWAVEEMKVLGVEVTSAA